MRVGVGVLLVKQATSSAAPLVLVGKRSGSVNCMHDQGRQQQVSLFEFAVHLTPQCTAHWPQEGITRRWHLRIARWAFCRCFLNH